MYTLQEWKIAFVGFNADGTCATGEPFVATNLKNNGPDFRAFADEETVIAFAKEALLDLQKSMRGCFLPGPILRVDVMQMADGRLVVNEIESLEALLIDAQGRRSSFTDSDVKTFLFEFWYKQLEAIVREAAYRRGF